MKVVSYSLFLKSNERAALKSVCEQFDCDVVDVVTYAIEALEWALDLSPEVTEELEEFLTEAGDRGERQRNRFAVLSLIGSLDYSVVRKEFSNYCRNLKKRQGELRKTAPEVSHAFNCLIPPGDN